MKNRIELLSADEHGSSLVINLDLVAFYKKAVVAGKEGTQLTFLDGKTLNVMETKTIIDSLLASGFSFKKSPLIP